MENRRFILICVFGVLLFFVYQAWQQDQAQLASEPPPELAAESELPQEADDDLPQAPGADEPAAPQDDVAPAADSNGEIRVSTDIVRARISLRGGDIRHLALLDYPESEARPDPLPILDDSRPKWSVLQSGVLAPQGNPATQQSIYRSEQRQYRLREGEESVTVTLETESETGVRVIKRLRFHRGSYVVDVAHEVINNSGASIDASPFTQLWRNDHTLGDQPPFAPTFTGYGFYEARDGGSRYGFEKIAFDDVADDPLEVQQTGGWLAMMQHYFIVAALPPQDEALRFTAKPSSRWGYLGQIVGSTEAVPDGASATFESRVFAGPKLQKELDDIAPGLGLTIDYGILTPLSAPLFWVLDLLHSLLGNWGWAIVALTLLVKMAMYKLSEAQFRSFGKMRHFGPRIQELRERYGDDRQKLNQAMMDLYKKEGFNPLGGCLPMLVQFPVFIALYWVLLESVELRQAPFIGWITNLSTPDPYYVLPVLFGGSMWLQQKLSGQMATMEPMQQRIMMAMPIMLTAFFTLFPAGLVLYWFVSNLVSIAQQYFINRKLDREGLGRKKA